MLLSDKGLFVWVSMPLQPSCSDINQPLSSAGFSQPVLVTQRVRPAEAVRPHDKKILARLAMTEALSPVVVANTHGLCNDHTPIPIQALRWALGSGGLQDDMALGFVFLNLEWKPTFEYGSPQPLRSSHHFLTNCSSSQVFGRECWHQPAGCPRK